MTTTNKKEKTMKATTQNEKESTMKTNKTTPPATATAKEKPMKTTTKNDTQAAATPAPIDWEAVKNSLPHGSGIDCDWTMKTKENRATFYNAYHGMNESGIYDGWLEFRVEFFRHKKDKLNPLSGPCSGKVQVLHRAGDWDFRVVGRFSEIARRSWGYGLRDYLEEIIDDCLEDDFPHLCGKSHGTIDA